VIALDLKGVAVSGGSACTPEPPNQPRPSAMGVDKNRARASLRFSLLKTATEADVDYVLEVVPEAVEHLRTLSRWRPERWGRLFGDAMKFAMTERTTIAVAIGGVDSSNAATAESTPGLQKIPFGRRTILIGGPSGKRVKCWSSANRNGAESSKCCPAPADPRRTPTPHPRECHFPANPCRDWRLTCVESKTYQIHTIASLLYEW